MSAPAMIPQVIHYCWFGQSPLTELARRCIASWRKHMPQCRLQRWDETNFDVWAATYTAQAYRLGQYAHVSDFARLWVLYHHGGIYLDTDVELLRPLDDMIAAGAFMGQERPAPGGTGAMRAAPGLGMACEAGHPLVGRLLESYAHRHFVSPTGRTTDTIVAVTNGILSQYPPEPLGKGLVRCAGFTIYPWPYLCPINYFTGQMDLSGDTRAIHHYAASWVKPRGSLLSRLLRRARNLRVRWTCRAVI